MPLRDRLALLLLALATVGSLAAAPASVDRLQAAAPGADALQPGFCVNNLPEPGDRRCVFVDVPLDTTRGATALLP